MLGLVSSSLLKSQQIIGKYKVTSQSLGRQVQLAILPQAVTKTAKKFSGTFACVNLAVELGAYRQVACKTTKLKAEGSATQRMWRTVMKEVSILKSLSHVGRSPVQCSHQPLTAYPSQILTKSVMFS